MLRCITPKRTKISCVLVRRRNQPEDRFCSAHLQVRSEALSELRSEPAPFAILWRSVTTRIPAGCNSSRSEGDTPERGDIQRRSLGLWAASAPLSAWVSRRGGPQLLSAQAAFRKEKGCALSVFQ